MKKYAVHGVVEVEVVKEVWANSESEAYDKAHDQLSSLTEYLGNGGDDKIIGVDGDGESVFTHGNDIEYNDIEVLEENNEYFECPNDGCKCERRTDTDGTDYWFCDECFTSFDDDGNEVYPEAEDLGYEEDEDEEEYEEDEE